MSSAGRGRRKHKGHEEEEHENHERWLVSYADMVTLLMCLFIVLFAMSQVDKEKFAALASGLSASFGAPVSAMDTNATGSTASVLDGLPNPVDIAAGVGETKTSQGLSQEQVDAAAAQAALQRAEAIEAEATGAYDELAAVRDRIDAALAAAGYPGAAKYEIDERGLVVHVVSDGVLYDAESAALRADGVRVLNAIAPELVALPNHIRIEGHTNSIPVTPGGPYPSNWELSTDRATAVVRYLITRGLPAPRVSATGYADTQPLVPDSDPASVTVNRRVDVVVLSNASAEANAQLAALDAAHGN
ncbi:flagellar motor protein MotB [Geodermatophilus sp. URMC 64]